MQSSSRILSAGAALLCAALASPVAAHHSFYLGVRHEDQHGDRRADRQD